MNRLVSLKVMVLDHQGKSRAISEALSQRGCLLVGDPRLADVVLIDLDLPAHGKLQYAEACVEAGGRAFIYPHGATAGLMAIWDGLFPVSPIISGVLTSGPGHAEVARRYGYPHPVYDIGWSLCELRPRRATGRVENVLFASQHPKGNGHLSDWKLARNQDIFRRLLATPARASRRSCARRGSTRPPFAAPRPATAPARQSSSRRRSKAPSTSSCSTTSP